MNLGNAFVFLCLERIWFWNIKVVPPLALITENFLIKECLAIKGGKSISNPGPTFQKQADGPCR